ncbi:MAG: O-antigen ligase family protein [Mesorhizobium sp.]|uniref:O-antigen ligase family protein n=1 Tax=Mesorhizobium sp. M00.F.Ca.ET.217.01.1.1 TaxID=2500529 RepID=UPI000FD9F028|nr:O-antigen ligase family protein [Mesorhizobium sp. M00.F.Ca.ET.217.01.1.1]TGQ21739.1 O-antigen ligase domain-containing protein [Mesorhizobium sp. M00.F.Ca.ET.217.01.1.1]TGV93067.1 O-antigen ligase domain-containing protein [Mesorhizobium sp. M00.F.Ca.ET.158.01.1.1]TIU87716.1 MAG: O-antigen ligase family protein [Mesorhizobium sp.]TKB44058.1 MAG: O-antigen ligase family protein [Mesorhizobium sp.]
MLQASILLLIVSIWFPGATRIAGTDGSISFLLALFCGLVSLVPYAEATKRLHRTDTALATAVLTTSALILVLSLLSALHADNPVRTMRAVFAQVFGFATIPTIALIAARPRSFEAIDRIGMTMAIMVAVTSCLVVIGLGDARFADRAEGYFKHANQLGIALSAGLPLVAAKLVASRRHRILLSVCLLAGLLGLVKSGSKTNFVLGVVGLGTFYGLYCIYLVIRKQRPVTVIAATVTAPILFQASFMMLQFLNPRAYKLLSLQLSGGEAHSIVSRQRLWSISIDLGLSHPFMGVGAGQWVGDIAPHSHNLFIDYFRTLGVPGLALVVIMVLLVVGYLISAVLHTLVDRGRSEQATEVNVMVLGTSVAVWNYLVANQMSDSFGPSTAAFFWLPLALLIVYRGMQRSLQTGLAKTPRLYVGTGSQLLEVEYAPRTSP